MLGPQRLRLGPLRQPASDQVGRRLVVLRRSVGALGCASVKLSRFDLFSLTRVVRARVDLCMLPADLYPRVADGVDVVAAKLAPTDRSLDRGRTRAGRLTSRDLLLAWLWRDCFVGLSTRCRLRGPLTSSTRPSSLPKAHTFERPGSHHGSLVSPCAVRLMVALRVSHLSLCRSARVGRSSSRSALSQGPHESARRATSTQPRSSPRDLPCPAPVGRRCAAGFGAS